MRVGEEMLIIASHLLFAIFVFGGIANLWMLVRGLFGSRKGSGIPLVPGLLGMTALLIAPEQSDIAHWKPFWWMPLVADVGCVPWLLICLSSFAKHRWRKDKAK